jgi:uncharacterized protein (UPF0333 family)
MLKVKHTKAQSTLEYIVILTAIVGVILYFATTKIGGGVGKSMDDTKTAMENAADRLNIATGNISTGNTGNGGNAGIGNAGVGNVGIGTT